MKAIFKKIGLLNHIVFRSMAEGDNMIIVKNFTEESIKVLQADFGFAWGKFNGNEVTGLAYKSPKIPFNPVMPRIGDKNSNGINSLFEATIKKSTFSKDISKHAKSYIIIPVCYVNHIYGSIVLFYKTKHHFTEEELALADAIGNMLAQAVTINWLTEEQQKSLALVEKQRETQILLDQEKSKNEFITNVTHEFRTPLAIMRGNVELALLDKSQRSARTALEVADQEIIHLSNLISDLALLVSAEKREDKLHYTEVNISDLIHKVVRRLKILARKKKISITIKSKKRGINVMAEEKYLDKVFLNLIRNAITYGKERGHIEVVVEKNKNKAIIKVVDDGIGIPKDELPRIFERFFRAKKAREMSDIGTGLGLSIVKYIAELHGGNVDAKSVEGKGSTFTVTLPLMLNSKE